MPNLDQKPTPDTSQGQAEGWTRILQHVPFSSSTTACTKPVLYPKSAPEQNLHQRQRVDITLPHGSVAHVYRGKVKSCIPSSSSHHTGWPSQWLPGSHILELIYQQLQPNTKSLALACSEFFPSSFFSLFNLSSIGKPPQRRKALCTNEKWKFHSWNLFQSSTTSEKKINSDFWTVFWCHSASSLHIKALVTTFKGLIAFCLTSGQIKSLVKTWVFFLFETL